MKVLLQTTIHPWGVEVLNTATQALELDKHGVVVEWLCGGDGIVRELIPWTMIKLVRLMPPPPPPAPPPPPEEKGRPLVEVLAPKASAAPKKAARKKRSKKGAGG